jgi:hypothetical protein
VRQRTGRKNEAFQLNTVDGAVTEKPPTELLAPPIRGAVDWDMLVIPDRAGTLGGIVGHKSEGDLDEQL